MWTYVKIKPLTLTSTIDLEKGVKREEINFTSPLNDTSPSIIQLCKLVNVVLAKVEQICQYVDQLKGHILVQVVLKNRGTKSSASRYRCPLSHYDLCDCEYIEW